MHASAGCFNSMRRTTPGTSNHSRHRCPSVKPHLRCHHRPWQQQGIDISPSQTQLTAPHSCSASRKLRNLHAGSSSSSSSSSSSPLREVFCFDIEVVASAMPSIITSCAWAAASALWPDRIVGSPSVYERSMGTVLQAVRQPHEAVVMVRLLCDEGIVGARSTAGRSGPVVGRAIRQSGSRPLLLAEVLEHSDMVVETCLTRWSLEQGCTRAELMASVSAAYSRAQQAYMPQADDGSDGEVECSSASAAAAPGCRTAVQAIKESRSLVYVASSHPMMLSRQLMRASGLEQQHATLVKGPTLVDAVSHIRQLQDHGDTLHVIVSSESKAQLVLSSAAAEAGANAQVQTQLHVAEWCCIAPSLRARVLCSPSVNLLAEHQLAQLLRVEDSHVVMDGVAWK